MNPILFTKMHGLGNDFVVIDARTRPHILDTKTMRAIAERRSGVGCDQLILIERAREAGAAARMRIFNADGGEVRACGNAARCVALLIMREQETDRALIETAAGLVVAEGSDDGRIRVDLGRAGTDWRDIPLSQPADTLHIPLTVGPLSDAVAVSVGNPHTVFFVPGADRMPLAELGPEIEHHPLFPERTNVELVQVLDRYNLRVRVWERGVGVTQACGTGACAAAVAARRRELTEARLDVMMDGGRLGCEWRADGHVVLTGPASISFRGVLDPLLLNAAGSDA